LSPDAGTLGDEYAESNTSVDALHLRLAKPFSDSPRRSFASAFDAASCRARFDLPDKITCPAKVALIVTTAQWRPICSGPERAQLAYHSRFAGCANVSRTVDHKVAHFSRVKLRLRAMATDNIIAQLAAADTTEIEGQTPPSEAVVDFIHGRASTTRPEDLHHTLGTGQVQASPGNHQHNGKDSKFVLDGANVTLTDITAGATGAQIATAVNAINALFRTYFGSS
jgi:hypothetical protein